MSVLVRLCGSVPNCEPWSPFTCVCADGLCSSSILALETALQPTQATSSPPHTGSCPLLYTHCLRSQTAPTPSHLHNPAPSHTCSSPPGPCTFMYMYPLHTTPQLCQPRYTHTHLSHIYICTHLTSSYHTGTTLLDLPVTPIPHLTYAQSLSHTHNRHSPSLIPVHTCTHTTSPHQLSRRLCHTSQFICVLAKRAPTS